MSIVNTVASLTIIIRGLVKDQIQIDGNNVSEYDTDNIFNISQPFVDSTTFVVYQNGEAISSNDYSYNADTNQITIVFITSGKVLTKGDIIRITYNYYKKYSDTEIKQFLESSFSYFIQHRYKKVFELDTSGLNIVAINGVDPSISELYFISLIASILIDPQNISVNTADFKLSANRKTSDQEQISKAFAQFKRFVGTLKFEEFNNLNNGI